MRSIGLLVACVVGTACGRQAPPVVADATATIVADGTAAMVDMTITAVDDDELIGAAVRSSIGGQVVVTPAISVTSTLAAASLHQATPTPCGCPPGWSRSWVVMDRGLPLAGSTCPLHLAMSSTWCSRSRGVLMSP
jgi:hypothetical protein